LVIAAWTGENARGDGGGEYTLLYLVAADFLKQVSLPHSSVWMTDPCLPFCNRASIFARYPVANACPVQAVSIVITTVATKSRIVILVMPPHMHVELMLRVRT
jgi:hypothetical protein